MMGNAREYRSTTFALLFGEKKEALALCNALYGTAYTENDEIVFNTLTNAEGVTSGFCAASANDLAFVLKDYQHVFEQQATVNPNMPLRMLEYFVEILRKSVLKGRAKYGSKKVEMPAPRFVVFYNGTDEQPDEVVYRLSDLYKEKEETPELELAVRVLNINTGHNRGLMERCSVLEQYTEFTGRVHERLISGMNQDEVKAAVREVCEICIREGILSEFLAERTEEIAMSEWWEYDEKEHDKVLGDEKFEDGRAVGRKEGRDEGREEGREEGGFQEICDSVADGDMTFDKAVKRAEKRYKVKDEADFRRRAKEIGFDF